jgi:hypothetical protein
MAAGLVADIMAFGVHTQQPFHAVHQVGLRRFEDQVEVIAHQAVGVNLPFGFAASFRQGREEELAVGIVQDDVVSLIAPAHHMVDGPGVFDSQLARHGANFSQSGTSVNSED